MRREISIVWFGCIAGAAAWLLFGSLDHLLFHESEFWGSLLTDSHELFMSAVTLALFTTLGFLFARILKQRRIEEQLQAANLNLTTTLESISDGFISLDRDLTVVYFNQAAEDLLGRKSDEVLGQSLFEAFPEAEGSVFEENYRLAVNGTEPFSFETFFEVPPYTNWYEVRVYPHKEGVSVYFLVTTEQKQAAEELNQHRKHLEELVAERTAQLKAILESTAEGVLVVDASEKIIHSNKRFSELWQVTEPLIGSSENFLVSVLDQLERPGRFLAKVQQLRNSPDEDYDTLDIRDGRIFEQSSLPLIQEGKISGRVWCFSDVTQRKRAEFEIQESQEQYRILSELAPVGIYRTDLEGNLLYLNERMCQIAGLEHDEALGQGWLSAIHPDDLGRVYQEWEQAVKDELPDKTEYRYRTADGITTWVLDQMRFERDSEGRVCGCLGSITDITDRKQMEEELLKVEKLESLGVLAGGIAHDLNNLLTGVVGNLSLAKLHEDLADKNGAIEEALKASMRVEALTQKLLTFSKGGSPIQRRAEIGPLISNSVHAALQYSSVAGDCSIQDNLWAVLIDEAQINQVINNIISNAEQAMQEVGTVRVSAQNILLEEGSNIPLEGGPYVKISFQDEGEGMEDELMRRIFDPFFTTKETGNGLGLATAYSIIKKHSGFITVESEVGVGSQFDIYLPALPDAELDGKGAEKANAIKGQGNILVMDDEEIIRRLVVQSLQRLGYKVTTSADGAEAVAAYNNALKAGNPFDVVILDLTIPGGMGGSETIKQLLELNPNVKAIVASGYSNDPIMANFGDYGFRGVITKPYSVAELSQVLHLVIDEH